jgi:hypothetical protein
MKIKFLEYGYEAVFGEDEELFSSKVDFQLRKSIELERGGIGICHEKAYFYGKQIRDAFPDMENEMFISLVKNEDIYHSDFLILRENNPKAIRVKPNGWFEFCSPRSREERESLGIPISKFIGIKKLSEILEVVETSKKLTIGEYIRLFTKK